MDKPTIISIHKFRESIANAVNTYIEEIPATVIANDLHKIANQFDVLAEQQYQEALKLFNTESEVEQNARDLQKNN